MKAHRLIAEATFDTDQLNAIRKAFDVPEEDAETLDAVAPVTPMVLPLMTRAFKTCDHRERPTPYAW
jgi:hypothetical protein